jgi:hypothetical protein
MLSLLLDYRVRFALLVVALVLFVVIPAVACNWHGDGLGIANCINNPSACQ